MSAQEDFVADVTRRAGGELTPGLKAFCDLIMRLSDQQFHGSMRWIKQMGSAEAN